MPTQNKFVKRYITWVVKPDGSAYLDSIMKEKKEDAPKRFEHFKNYHFLDGIKFVHVPIEIQVPNELDCLVKEDSV